MNKSNQWGLKAGINRILEGGVQKIKAVHITTYSHGDIEVIDNSLKEWQERGYLRILKPYQDCSPEEHCVEMIKFIDQKSPIKGYLNWE